ncbi:hypothetical protein AALO_G00266210 [Alosa alosa]|uniref:Uncharacterized protein n=1 Tax=Alosa alosa TaxID=278164 RepID=A0AAV6FPF1_9TELE|nr:hypothetical protein AALO_G00266210 [Alosa alosa]
MHLEMSGVKFVGAGIGINVANLYASSDVLYSIAAIIIAVGFLIIVVGLFKNPPPQPSNGFKKQ